MACATTSIRRTSIPAFPKSNVERRDAGSKQKSTNGTATEKTPNHPPSFGTYALPDGFRHGSEDDVGGYRAQPAEGCSQTVGHGNRYKAECLDRLRNIVYEPRCTARYDSRIECNGQQVTGAAVSKTKSFTGQQQPAPQPPVTHELVKEHFGNDSLGVVILGAGPIGLMLANALAVLPLWEAEGEESVFPPIKMLVMESGADAPGLKRTYT